MMAHAAFGTFLKKGSTVIGQLTSIGGLNLSADTRETTVLDSPDGYRTFEQGLKDGGDVSISGYYDPAEHQGLLDDFNDGETNRYTIEFPPSVGAKWEFDAAVTAYNTGAELEDNISFESTLKVSGKPNLISNVPPKQQV